MQHIYGRLAVLRSLSDFEDKLASVVSRHEQPYCRSRTVAGYVSSPSRMSSLYLILPTYIHIHTSTHVSFDRSICVAYMLLSLVYTQQVHLSVRSTPSEASIANGNMHTHEFSSIGLRRVYASRCSAYITRADAHKTHLLKQA